jgi:hypothetical protein
VSLCSFCTVLNFSIGNYTRIEYQLFLLMLHCELSVELHREEWYASHRKVNILCCSQVRALPLIICIFNIKLCFLRIGRGNPVHLVCTHLIWILCHLTLVLLQEAKPRFCCSRAYSFRDFLWQKFSSESEWVLEGFKVGFIQESGTSRSLNQRE